MGTIVVGVADAASSRRAAEWAVTRAASTGSDVLLLSVIGGAVGAAGEAELVDRVRSGTENRLAAVAEQLGRGGVRIATRVERGNPVSVLTDASKDAELVVIGGAPLGAAGRRGRHGARVAAGAHSPVVVVPEADGIERSGVVVGVDGSEVSRAAIAFAAAEAERLTEPLSVLSVWMPVAVPGDFGMYPDTYLTDLEAIAGDIARGVADEVREQHPALRVATLVGQGDPAGAIVEAAKDAALCVVGSHGRGPVGRFLLGSVSEEVLAHLPTVTAVVR